MNVTRCSLPTTNYAFQIYGETGSLSEKEGIFIWKVDTSKFTDNKEIIFSSILAPKLGAGAWIMGELYDEEDGCYGIIGAGKKTKISGKIINYANYTLSKSW